jgi:pescadillo protein
MLPPHLSPFVDEQQDGYVPPERKEYLRQEKELLKTGAEQDQEPESVAEVGSKRKSDSDSMTDEEKKLAIMMMPKKKKALYDKIMHSKKKKASQVRKLEEKRKALDSQSQASKK